MLRTQNIGKKLLVIYLDIISSKDSSIEYAMDAYYNEANYARNNNEIMNST